MLWATIAAITFLAPGVLAQSKPKQSPPLPKTNAQELVIRFVSQHSDELEALELAIGTGRGCKTVAATHVEDLGEACDEDELTAMRTNEPYVEAPTKNDPVYDITQALHDTTGALIGAAGMDLKPQAGQDRAAMVARARALLRELETQIPSVQKLEETTGR
jgi:hypothetical protein